MARTGDEINGVIMADVIDMNQHVARNVVGEDDKLNQMSQHR